jgi:pyridoxal phosphate-dependent aminotransferase EpsN
MCGREQEFVAEAFAGNWIAPLGPQVDAFEAEFAAAVGAPFALAVTSGTAAIHLALILAGVSPGDEVLVSDLTFAASVNPICYLGARPVLIDAEPESWCMSPELLAEALEKKVQAGRRPKAVVLVHLYGQPAHVAPILDCCDRHGIPLIEDAAEALGATYQGASPGVFGKMGIFSFNGNKIITTSGGGMLVSADARAIAYARKLSTQARDPAPHYQHSEIGYNYRMSNVLAAIGRGQLSALTDRVAARRCIFETYRSGLADLPGIGFMPEAPWGSSSRWLTVITLDPTEFGATADDARQALERENIEARPVWKPMHLQPVFSECEIFGGAVSESLFACGLCLPSGSSLSESDQARVISVLRSLRP